MIPSEAGPRVSTGVGGLDRMLGGGLIPGRPYLLTGGTGSGKTLLGLSFLLEGVRLGDSVLLVAVDEPPHEIMENVQSFGWDLSAIRTLDANPGQRAIKRMNDVQEIRALGDVRSMRDIQDNRGKSAEADDISIQSIHLKLRQQMTTRNFTRVVVDSLASIRRFAMKQTAEPQAERTEIQSLLRFLSEREVTTVLTGTPIPSGVLAPEEILARGEIQLTRKWIGDRAVRQVKIIRMRGSAHDLERRPFTITPEGVKVG
ncbi:MAG: RAD55 family ATPase [Thermoplasmata archaeon]